MNRTVMVIAAVAIIWVVLFIIFMIINNKRKTGEKSFIEENQNKALVNLYGKSIRIDNKGLSELEHTTGEYAQKIVALDSGLHTIEGIFQTTDIGVGKNINLESEKVKFEVHLDAGHKYTVGMYLHSPEENGDGEKAILDIPLTLYQGSKDARAYIIVYKED